MTEKEIKQMQAEIERLRADNARLQSEMIRLVGRNLELSEQLEVDVELRLEEKRSQHCCHCRSIGFQPCAHPTAPHHGRHRHDTCRLQGPFHTGYVTALCKEGYVDYVPSLGMEMLVAFLGYQSRLLIASK